MYAQHQADLFLDNHALEYENKLLRAQNCELEGLIDIKQAELELTQANEATALSRVEGFMKSIDEQKLN